MQNVKLVAVQTCGDRLEADLAKSALEASGIPAMIQADTVGGMREHVAWSGAGFKILVREEDAAAARDVLAPPEGTLVNEGDDSPDADLEIDRDARPPGRRFT